MKKLALIIAAGAMTLPVATPAMADPPRHANAWGKRAKDQQRIYDSRGRYYEPRRLGRDDRVWRGDDGRWRCRRDNGTTGLLIGAGVGALAGRAIDTRGDRTLGTVLGAVGGGLLGREIDRGDIRCR
ncbi:glycine zipper 2TM domain-containing protein [Erythrobacter sp. WG]|uniref:glycine zipper 2TM domain-containing protein n=1 Tax=Erythrobacter sp. WG TaxID=2985510 RepID=UPI002271A3A3|nr:glycine zipper 2TM domain-containing protein [Erythrobacter sp. WG]MCX9146816.1 glycine zipper 2TM domain-containing protein [Erythrobacter sp. WG]